MQRSAKQRDTLLSKESSVTQRKERQTNTTERNKMQRKAAHVTKGNAKRLRAVHQRGVAQSNTYQNGN